MAFQSVQFHASVLVVDDEPDLRTLYELTLVREGYLVESAATVNDAWQLLQDRQFDIVITDMRLPDGLGLELLRRLRADQRPERCVVITAYGSAQNAVDSLKAGAFDYLTKPVDLKQFRALIASATLQAEVQSARGGHLPALQLGQQSQPKGDSSGGEDQARRALASLIGRSAPMLQARERISKVAKSMAPVLIRGESGTGKELAARALHANSHRWRGPLIAVNCSAIPENLLEAEFFGAKKGAYTGATADRMGYFQSASGGTLFLDEIGDLPLAMQAKLLRAVQERTVRPLGSSGEEPVDVRIVSATHKDLAQGVRSGAFRQDLFYRLNVIEIVMPALRDRRGDLPELCRALIKRIAFDANIPEPALSEGFLAQLCSEPFHGNVRELENHLHRAVALSDGGFLQGDPSVLAGLLSAPLPLRDHPHDAAIAQPTVPTATEPAPLGAASAPKPGDLQEHLDREERQVLIATLQDCGFNRTAAAAKLGLSLRQIRYRMARLHIEVPLTDGTNPAEALDEGH